MSLNVNGTTVANPEWFSSTLLHQIHHHLQEGDVYYNTSDNRVVL